MIRRCRTLLELHDAMALVCGRPLGGQTVLGRVQPVSKLTMAEELYQERLSVTWRDPAGRPSLLIVQHGRCVVEAGVALMPLQAHARNACWLDADRYTLTITQPPTRLLRLVLPAGSHLLGLDRSRLKVQGRSWSVDLSLLLLMGQLVDQAQQKPAHRDASAELAETLLNYLWDRLSEAGCEPTLPGVEVAAEPVDPLEQLQAWVRGRLAEPLELADLASAVNLSPRRLQQLTRERHRCTPMEWLRTQRLAVLRQKLNDRQLADRPLDALMDELHLSNSAATRNTFVRLYGTTPAAYRRLAG